MSTSQHQQFGVGLEVVGQSLLQALIGLVSSAVVVPKATFDGKLLKHAALGVLALDRSEERAEVLPDILFREPLPAREGRELNGFRFDEILESEAIASSAGLIERRAVVPDSALAQRYCGQLEQPVFNGGQVLLPEKASQKPRPHSEEFQLTLTPSVNHSSATSDAASTPSFNRIVMACR